MLNSLVPVHPIYIETIDRATDQSRLKRHMINS